LISYFLEIFYLFCGQVSTPTWHEFFECIKLKTWKGHADNYIKLVGIIPGSERANYSERVGRKVSGLQPPGQGSGIAEMPRLFVL
jgi:hypothetical protein